MKILNGGILITRATELAVIAFTNELVIGGDDLPLAAGCSRPCFIDAGLVFTTGRGKQHCNPCCCIHEDPAGIQSRCAKFKS